MNCKTCDAQLAGKQKVFCSNACHRKSFWGPGNPAYRGGKKKANCLTCGVIFEHIPSQPRKYCSRKCSFDSPMWQENNRKGQIGRKATAETKAKLSAQRKGRKHSAEWVQKRIMTRKKHFDKIGRRTPKLRLLRNSDAMLKWKVAVFNRDKMTCQHCGCTNKRSLEAHHIIPFGHVVQEAELTRDDSLLWDIGNGVTLCRPCHKKTDSYAKYTANTIEGKLFIALRQAWEQQGKGEEFESFYRKETEAIISKLKMRLD